MPNNLPPNPIFDEERGFRIWHISEVYSPGTPSTSTTKGRFVPNVGDLIIDYSVGFMRVTTVDRTTGRYQWVKWSTPFQQSNHTDGLLGGYGAHAVIDPPRVFINDSVMPHTLAIDSRYCVHGSSVRAMRVYRGSDVSEHGEIVSMHYDQSGNFMGVDIPVDPVQNVGVVNGAVRAPQIGHTLKKFEDGELLTAVFYSDAAQVVSMTPLRVVNTAFIHRSEQSKRYIRSIALESPFISPSDPETIEYPINMPVTALNLTGVVTYSDGSVQRLPVDGTKFSIYGLRNFVATAHGQEFNAVLTYHLDSDEYNYMQGMESGNQIKRQFKIRTRPADGAYNVRLYVLPKQVRGQDRYELAAYLYTLDRSHYYDVSSRIQPTVGSAAFNPTAYGISQELAFAVNMQSVNSSYKRYRHVETMTINLLASTNTVYDQDVDTWTVQVKPNTPVVGTGLRARYLYKNGSRYVKLDSGITSLDEWLSRTYYAMEPIFDPDTESKAPEPTHFIINCNGRRKEVPVTQWNRVIELNDMLIEGGDTIYLHFLKRESGQVLHLGMCGMRTLQVSSMLGVP